MRRICTICARAGSQRLKDKNVLPLGGLPLLVHGIRHARDSGLFDTIGFSSDSDAYCETARAHGADVVVSRSSELALPSIPKIHAIRDLVARAEAMTGMEYATIVELGATTPLRRSDDVRKAVSLLESNGASSVISGAKAHRRPDLDQVVVDDRGRASPVLGKHSMKERRIMDMNGAIYAWRRYPFMDNPSNFYEDTLFLEMPRRRSIDIDDDFDYKIAKFLFEQTDPEIGENTTDPDAS